MTVRARFVDLSEYGIQPPEDRVRMVLAQPHLPETAFTPNEPFRLTGEARTRQFEIVERTLDIASTCSGSPGATQFTILPEYCIPGLTGVELIEKRLRTDSWPNGTVVIGGLDGVDKDEYSQLLSPDDTYHDKERNGVARVAEDQWLNCSITWVKSSQGQVFRWVQPKLWPAWPEASSENQRMFKGGSIYLFRGQRVNGESFIFGTLVCFDWIAPSCPNPYERILSATHCEANGAQLPLTWLFVIQRNERPSHHDFLNNVVSFFRERAYPNATRANTCLVFANTAGSEHPGYCANYGSTSLILGSTNTFMTSEASQTLSHQGYRFREENPCVLKSGRCTDVFFRERGECIHMFEQVNPSWIVPGPPGKSYAAENAEVHAASNKDYLLAPGRGVPAAVKWANDVLDQISDDLPQHEPMLKEVLDKAHATVTDALRCMESTAIPSMVKLSTPTNRDNIDTWSGEEHMGLQHVLYTLRVLGADNRLKSVGEAMVHGVVAFSSREIDVVAICGFSHEKCIKHFENLYQGQQRKHLLLVSRDKENTSWDPKYGSILRVEPESEQESRKITEDIGPTYHIGYQDILRFLSEATELEDIEKRIETHARK